MTDQLTAMMTQFEALAQAAGATHVRVVETAPLRAEESVRYSCSLNGCGKYGSNWMCPPRVGELEELQARMHAYPAGILLQNIATLEDSWDFEGMEAAIKTHNAMLRQLARQFVEAVPGCQVLALGCGGCGLCERCTCPDAPCRFPEQAMASVEGYGLDIKRLVERHGLSYINGINTVSYVGMILFRQG